MSANMRLIAFGLILLVFGMSLIFAEQISRWIDGR